MSTKIRLKRFGGRQKPRYRVVVTDSRKPRDGRVIEEVGTYDPTQDPPAFQVDDERVKDWLSKGAQPTERVKKLLDRRGQAS